MFELLSDKIESQLSKTADDFTNSVKKRKLRKGDSTNEITVVRKVHYKITI